MNPAFFSTIDIYTRIIAVGPLSGCLCVAEILRDQWSDRFHFWYICQADTRDCTYFFCDLWSKVKVTSEVKVIPKIKSAGKLIKRVEN